MAFSGGSLTRRAKFMRNDRLTRACTRPPKNRAAGDAPLVMRTPSPVGMATRSRIAGCRSVTTPIQLRDCHISMNTTCQSMKLRTSSVDRYKTYADVMILALRSVRLERDDI